VSQLQDKSKPGTKWDWQLKVSSNSTPILHNTSSADTFYGVRNVSSSEVEMRRLNTNSPILQALATIVSENAASSHAPEQQPASTSRVRH